MNTREAMKALLEGKKITRSGWSGICFKYLDAEGMLRNDAGEHSELYNFDDYELYEEPNPHPKGTFAWAREEAKRGREVCRVSFRLYQRSVLRAISNGFKDPGIEIWSLEDIDATDWEVVS